MMTEEKSYDVILVGGGVMGSAIAYWLMTMNERLDVAVIERDSTYAQSSTTLSDGNHRVQFNLKENILMSLYGLEVLEGFAEEMAVEGVKPDVAFRRQGNLYLIDGDAYEEARVGLELQQSLGGRVDWLSPAELVERFPFIDPGACLGATFGRSDGTMDPYAVLMAYRNKAISLGVTFIESEVSAVRARGKRAVGVRLASGGALDAWAVVNSAGAWASRLAQTAGITLPVQPVMRQVFVIEAAVTSEETLPLILLPTGLYLIHEHGGRFMCGKSLPDDPVGFDFRWNQGTFNEHLWPELVEYVPAFDRLKVVSGWAGLYAVNTLDGNAILGEWPELPGFYLANGFSGHGFQQCHAVGRYLAELILGRPPALDLSVFSPERILANEPVFESKRRLI